MNEDYNCFKCCGYVVSCHNYFGLKEETKCVYKKVADEDLKKHKSGNKFITLGTMLEKYLEGDLK